VAHHVWCEWNTWVCVKCEVRVCEVVICMVSCEVCGYWSATSREPRSLYIFAVCRWTRGMLPAASWSERSDGRWPQHTVSSLTVVHGHKCHRKTPSLHHTIMHKALNRWCERPTNFYKWHGWWWLNDDDYADDGVVLLITIQAINCRTGERLIMHAQ